MRHYVEKFYNHGGEQRKIAKGQLHTGNYLQDFKNLVLKDLPSDLVKPYNKDDVHKIWHHKIPISQIYPVTRRIDPKDVETIRQVQSIQDELGTYLGGNPSAGLWVPHKEHLKKIHPLYKKYGIEPGSEEYSKLQISGLKGLSPKNIGNVSKDELLDALYEYIEFAGPRSDALINIGLDQNIVKGNDNKFYKRDSGKILTLNDVLQEEEFFKSQKQARELKIDESNDMRFAGSPSFNELLKSIRGDTVQIGNNPRIRSPGNNY